MNRWAVIAAGSILLAAPASALAQQQQQNPLGQTLENLGRSLQGQGADRGIDRGDTASRDAAYRHAYDDNRRAFSRYSDDELRRADRQIGQARAELDGASRALDDELDRRGDRGMSGSSRPQRGDRDRSDDYRGR